MTNENQSPAVEPKQGLISRGRAFGTRQLERRGVKPVLLVAAVLGVQASFNTAARKGRLGKGVATTYAITSLEDAEVAYGNSGEEGQKRVRKECGKFGAEVAKDVVAEKVDAAEQAAARAEQAATTALEAVKAMKAEKDAASAALRAANAKFEELLAAHAEELEARDEKLEELEARIASTAPKADAPANQASEQAEQAEQAEAG